MTLNELTTKPNEDIIVFIKWANSNKIYKLITSKNVVLNKVYGDQEIIKYVRIKGHMQSILIPFRSRPPLDVLQYFGIAK